MNWKAGLVRTKGASERVGRSENEEADVKLELKYFVSPMLLQELCISEWPRLVTNGLTKLLQVL